MLLDRSYTPVIVRLLNLPPRLRTSAAGLFMWAHLPPGVELTEAMRFLLRKELDLFQTGLDVYDAYQETNRSVSVQVTRILEDGRYLDPSFIDYIKYKSCTCIFCVIG